MSYEAVFTVGAEGNLGSLNIRAPWLYWRVLNLIEAICESPSVGSRPTVSPPFPPGGMMHQAEFEEIGSETTWYVTVFFRYGADEKTLYIEGIGFYDI